MALSAWYTWPKSALCRGKKDEKSTIGSRDDPVWSSQRECRRRHRHPRLHQLNDKQTINYRSNYRSLIATDPDTGDPMQILQYGTLHKYIKQTTFSALFCFLLFSLSSLCCCRWCCCFWIAVAFLFAILFVRSWGFSRAPKLISLAIVQCNLHYVLVSI